MSELADAVVVGGCLLSFASEVCPQDQQDVQDCLLYAELAANDKYPGQVSKKVWFDYYQGRLLKAGFTLKAIVPSEPLRVSNVNQLLSISHTIIGRLGSERLGQLIEETYGALKLDEFAWNFFRGNIAHGGSGILKFAPCERLASALTPATWSSACMVCAIAPQCLRKTSFFGVNLTKKCSSSRMAAFLLSIGRCLKATESGSTKKLTLTQTRSW
ncbi:hypothetical protein ACIPIN_17970 [Pseudomonas sp. NPDC087697]|uniref:hypothetical protein n=1 Tax=Pseudomonas sp. NPDC087697 TaxID=3364447 RepID=UPI00382EF56A